MSNICCVTKEVLQSSNSLSNFKSYKDKLTREDIATLVETFEFAMMEVPVEMIVDVLRNPEGYFAFLIDKDVQGSFDFYKYLNDYSLGNITISPINAKSVYPRALSRGIYSEYGDDEEEDNPSSDMDDDEGATGYMDDDELPQAIPTVKAFLLYEKTGAKIQITREGTTIGRSQKTADFVLHGNTNVSRPHARVYLNGNTPMIHDENSKNGTFVQGNKVNPNKDSVLNDGDIVMLADEKFTVSVSK